MRYTARALLAVALLVGFYVLAAAVVAGLALGAWTIIRTGHAGYVAAKLGLVAVVVALAVGRALFRRRGETAPGGLLLTEADQPALWDEVRALAGEVGTRAPDEIRLVAEVNAAVSEDARLLGLVPGTRRLYVGVPLLLGLTPLELRSVLAHELGHYSARHTALAPVTYRGKEAIGRVIGELGPSSALGRVLTWYGRFYIVVAHSVARRQELEADDFSARLAGTDAAVSALRALAPLSAAWGHFVSHYAGLGMDLGRRPAPLLEGFASLLDDPEVRTQLEEIRGEEPDGTASRYDTHPPLAQRIARIEALPPQASARPAGPLLARRAETLAAFEEITFEGSDLTATPWPEVVAAASADHVRRRRHALGRLAGSEATFASFVQRISHRGPLGLLDGPADEERDVVASLLADAAADVLVSRDAATFVLDWAGPARLVAPDGRPIDPGPALEELSGSGDGRPFLAWLAEHGIDEADPLPVEGPAHPGDDQPRLHGAAALVRAPSWSTLLVTSKGLVVVPVTGGQRARILLRSLGGGSMQARALPKLVEQVLATPFTERLHGPGFLPWESIASATVTERRVRSSTIVLTFRDGRQRRMRYDATTHFAGEPWPAIAHHLGERLVVD